MAENNIINFNQPADFFYRSAQKMMDTGSYINALSVIRRAVNMDPDNREFSLFLAEILTELTRYEESNRVLFSLIEKDGYYTDPECFFGLGCNFMGLNDTEKAKESFEQYLELEPNGEYCEDIEDFLSYFNEDGSLFETYLENRQDEIFNKAVLGKEYLDRAEYKKAIEILEEINPVDDNFSYAKNNLALAYYCIGNVNKAVNITQDVLNKEPKNIHANCNMAIFLNGIQEESAASIYINTILSAKNNDIDELYKIAVTLCELKMHEKAIDYFKKLVCDAPYDEKVLFYYAIALHNIKRFKESIKLLNDVKHLDYPGVIAEYYIRKINNEILNPSSFEEINYIYQIPVEEAKKKIKYLNDCLKLSQIDFIKLWNNDDNFLNTALWGLEYGDDNIKRAIAGMIAGFADKKAERVLRNFILKKRQSDEVKNDVFILLKRMNAKEPYVAYIKDEVVEVKVGAYDENGFGLADEYVQLFKKLYEIIKTYYNEEVLKTAFEIIQALIDNENIKPSKENVSEFGALIIYYALKKSNRREPLLYICGKINANIDITKELIRKYKNYIN